MTALRIAFAALLCFGNATMFAQIPPSATSPADAPDQQNPAQPGGKDNSTSKGVTAKPNDNLSSPKPSIGPTVTQPNRTGNTTDSEEPEIKDDSNLTPEQKASVEYAGPAVLSRGITASQPMNPQNVKLTPQVNVDFMETKGLNGVTTSAPLGLESGIALSYGISGTKLLKKDILSLTYLGTFYTYFDANSFNSTSNQLSFSWAHKLSKRFEFAVREQLMEFSQNNVQTSGTSVLPSNTGSTFILASPATEVFDGRVLTGGTEGNILYHFNPRLSLSLFGSGFITRRYSNDLYGDVGYQGGADLVYRFTKRVSAGGYYTFTHFDYIGLYGGSDVNTVGLNYSIAFTRRTELSAKVGGSRVETTGVENHQLPPDLAAILGFNSTSIAGYHLNYAPDFSVQLRHQETNASYSLGFTRGITPGNGIILTSVRQNINFTAGYKTRRWNFGSSVGYDALYGYGTTNQQYKSVFATANAYRSLTGNFSWHFRFDYHHYLFDSTGYLQNNYTLAVGVAWSPADLLNRPW
jgi:hypothetical protein